MSEKRLLTHWGRVTHIWVGKPTIIGSDNGLSPDQRQAIIWTNAGILLIGTLGTYFSEILTGIQTFSLKKMHLKISSAKWRPFCLGLNVLNLITDALTLHLRWRMKLSSLQWCHRSIQISQIISSLTVCLIACSSLAIKNRAPHYLHEGNPPMIIGFTWQRASNVKIISMSWLPSDMYTFSDDSLLCSLLL